MRKIHLDEQAVIALYEKVETTGAVAREFNVSNETIRRILKRHGIKRTHRHPKPEPKYTYHSHCRSKYCPALIVMLHEAFGWNAKQIAKATGYAESGIQNVLSRRGLTSRPKKSDFDLDKIEYEYVTLGMTTYELGKKYGIHHETVGEWMRDSGIHFGKGGHQRTAKKTGHNKSHQQLHDKALGEFNRNLKELMHGRFEYVRDFRKDGKPFAVVRCVECGHVFKHYSGFQGAQWDCPECKRREIEANRQHREQENDARRYERMFEEIREYALDKTCKICGSTFHSARKTALYCSDRCRHRANERSRSRLLSSFRHYYHVKYGELYLEHYDPSITLKKLYERDGGVCQICGDPCDWNDMEWGSHGPTYPSIDHIVPRAKGGEHKWSNVQLAHCICNSRKRDLMGDELQEVVTDVKVAC